MKRDFAIGAAWTAVATLLEHAAGAIIFLVIARLVGVEGYGVAAMAFAFLFLGEVLVRDTITEGIIERKSLEDGRLEATFVALLAFSLVVTLALVAISQVAVKIYGEPLVAPLLIAASPTVLMVGAAGVPTALLRRNLAYRTLAIRTIFGVFVGGAVGIVMALTDCGAWSLVGQRLAEIGVNSALAFSAAGWVPKRWPRRAEFRLLRGLGPRVVVLRTLTIVISQTPTVALGVFAAPRAAGLYAFAQRLAEIVLFLVLKPLRGVAQSAVAALRRQQGSTAPFFLDLVELAGFGAFTAFAGLALVADPLTVVLLGEDWREASAILPFLCIAGSVTALAAIQEAYLLAVDRMDTFLSATLVEALVGVVIVGLASRFGPAAAAAGVAARALLALPLRTSAALSPEGIPVMRLVRALASPLVLTVGMFIAVASWRIAVLGRIADVLFVVSAVALGVAVCGGLLFGLMPETVARLRTFVRKDDVHDHRAPS